MNEGRPLKFLDLLDQQLKIHVDNFLNPLKGNQAIFYMSTHLVDAICANNAFPDMKIGLYEIKNLKFIDIEGKAIDKFTFGYLDFNPYDPRNVYKYHYAWIHFQWPSGTFRKLDEEAWNSCYNASNSHKPIILTGTSQVTS